MGKMHRGEEKKEGHTQRNQKSSQVLTTSNIPKLMALEGNPLNATSLVKAIHHKMRKKDSFC